METSVSPAAVAAVRGDVSASDAGAVKTIAEDRLEGAEAIGRFIDPNMSLREVRRRLENGAYPCWKEGRRLVASKAALLKHWREKAEKATSQPQPGARQPQHKSTRRGYRPA